MFCSLLARCRIPCACHVMPHLNLQKWSEHVVLLTFSLGTVLCATTACIFSTCQLPKCSENCVFFVRFDFEMCFVPQHSTLFQHLNFQKFSEPASRRNGVHFFGHFNLKCSEAEVFVHLDFEMCFAPERRAIFHLSSGQMGPHAALASLLFDPLEPQIIGKTQWLATLLPFRAPTSSFF